MARHHQDHEFAVIGLGRFGGSLALELTTFGFSVLGIDHDPEVVQGISEDIARAVSLDATDEDALQAVDITAFDTVVVAIGTDFEANLLVASALKALGVRRVIAKAVTQRQRAILERIGVDQVVLPEIEAGRRLAHSLAEPHVLQRFDFGEEHHVLELRLPDTLAGRSLRHTDLTERYGLTVLAVKRDRSLQVAPPADFVFTATDLLVALGTREQVDRFFSSF
jgi:trk system potassium uptake protein TrkA